MTGKSETTRPAAMPADTPDYMAQAWYGCMSWAIDNDEIRSAFEAETGHHYAAPQNGFEHESAYVEAFVKWANVNVWGSMA